ncbi:MAG: UDP-N-acetylmuramate--L-alanine ligase [Armatimonadota bacterium]|nr:MAG: UDP-N-acetylmuramate--L-alanine ligase [Armatimonadota bacterium]
MSGGIHMVGIGGIGMSALAQILLARGTPVSGSDAQQSDMLARLAGLGAAVHAGHSAQLVEGAERVVISDAIRPDNPELQRAEALGIPVQRRSQLLAELMAGSRGIAVSGTHGKTTVTAMIGAILTEAGLDPTVVLGGEYRPLGGNARVGRGDWFVVEACEAYESFLDLVPEIAVVTNIDPDHLDHHKTEAHLRASFAEFLQRVPPNGRLVLCADRPELHHIGDCIDRELVWYGTDERADVQGTGTATAGHEAHCQLSIEGRPSGEIRIATPGMHNVLNALGALAAARSAGAPLACCKRALAGFSGVARRFEIAGHAAGVTFIDDYAHHPAEIAATIAAARAAYPGRRIVAVFQPHLYSRTRDFAEDFACALSQADLAVLTEIYPAREAPLPGVSSSLIARHLASLAGKDGPVEMAKGELATELPAHLHPGDAVLVMGAGDIGGAARELVRRLGGEDVGRQEVVTKK